MKISMAQFKFLLKKNERLAILDVRPSMSFEKGHIKGAISMPKEQVDFRLAELDKDTVYYVICTAGVRSHEVSEKLNKYGYKAIDVDGGMLQWDEEVVSDEK